MLRKKTHEKIKKIDLLITSVVLGAIVAGAFGLKKKKTPEHCIEKRPSLLRKIFDIFLGK